MVAELRRRKLKDQTAGPKSKRPTKSKYGSGIQRSFICVLISGTILLLVFGLYVDSWELGKKAVDQIAVKFGHHAPVYAIVIDAGSTGSRILAFTFHKAYLDERLVLDKELFVESKPGLSSFANDPQKGAESIEKLLDNAKTEIPQEHWKTTPLVLKATAGLRLLPEKQAEALLDAVRSMFEKCPFHTAKDSVSIMDGVDEGIFSWFTVNFLLDRLSGNPVKMLAALDLGGGSTQVTFAPTTPATLKQKEYIHKVAVIRGSIPVYTHSYLGLGLMAARKAILTKNTNETVLFSACVNPIIKEKKWNYGGVEYTFSGKDNRKATKDEPVVDVNECVNVIGDYINDKVLPISELNSRQIGAFSYYYDRAIETGMVDAYNGGSVLVGEFKNMARYLCNDANVDQPLACLDVMYICVLLEKGFGLAPFTKINLIKKVNGHEISWALGAAFHELSRKN